MLFPLLFFPFFVCTWFSPIVFDFSLPSVIAFVHLDFVYSGLDSYSSFDPCMHFYIQVCFIQTKLNRIYCLQSMAKWKQTLKQRRSFDTYWACCMSALKHKSCVLLAKATWALSQSCAPWCSYIETRREAIAGHADEQEGWGLGGCTLIK